MEFAQIAESGPLLAALAVAALAGLVSFFAPCMLPLVPGYLAYVTGLAGADLAHPSRPRPDSPTRPDPASGVHTVAATRRTHSPRRRTVTGATPATRSIA